MVDDQSAKRQKPSTSQIAAWAFWLLHGCCILWLSISGFLTNGSQLGEVQASFAFAILIFLSCSLGAFTGLAQLRYRWFLMVPIGVVLGVLGNWSLDSDLDEIPEFVLFTFTIVLIVAITTLILRRLKGQLVRVESDHDHVDALQFGIRDVMVWTGLLAVFFGTGRLLMSMNSTVVRGNVVADILIIGSCVAAGIVIYIWAIFGQCLSLTKQFFSALTLFGSSIAMNYVTDDNMFWWATLGGQSLAILAMLLLRIQQYRFVKTTP